MTDQIQPSVGSGAGKLEVEDYGMEIGEIEERETERHET